MQVLSEKENETMLSMVEFHYTPEHAKWISMGCAYGIFNFRKISTKMGAQKWNFKKKRLKGALKYNTK